MSNETSPPPFNLPRLLRADQFAEVVHQLISPPKDGHLEYDQISQGEIISKAVEHIESALNHAVDSRERNEDPAPWPNFEEILHVTNKAVEDALEIAKLADDWDGCEIGGACADLILDIHPRVVAAAKVPPTELAQWFINYDGLAEAWDYKLDPVAYAPTLGPIGMKIILDWVEQLRESLADPTNRSNWYLKQLVDHMDERLAVLSETADESANPSASENHNHAHNLEHF